MVEDEPEKKVPPVYCMPIWMIGMACLIIGSLSNIVGVRIGNQVLCASTGTFSLIVNALMAIYCLKEAWYRSDLLAIFLMILGSLLFILNSKINENDDYTFD